MKPLDDFEKAADPYSKKDSLFQQLSVFVLPLFGCFGAIVFPILMFLFLACVSSFLGFFFD